MDRTNESLVEGFFVEWGGSILTVPDDEIVIQRNYWEEKRAKIFVEDESVISFARSFKPGKAGT